MRAYSGNGESPYNIWGGTTYSTTCPNSNDKNIYKSELVERWDDLPIAKVSVLSPNRMHSKTYFQEVL